MMLALWRLQGVEWTATYGRAAPFAVIDRVSYGPGAIYCQLPVLGRRYRLDFAIVTESHRIAIEVDGHDFHERTKEQAARDKSRDRALVAAGWTVLRFAGSEVWRDAYGCVAEVQDLLWQERSTREALASTFASGEVAS